MPKDREVFVFRGGQCPKNLGEEIRKHDVCTVIVEPGEPKKRSLSANALQNVWCDQIVEYTGHTRNQIIGYCKEAFGFPILRYNVEKEQERVAAFMINRTFDAVKYDNQSHDRRCEIAFKAPCTSLMSTRQHKIFMDRLQQEYAPGLILESR